jgi:O-antigen ligase
LIGANDASAVPLHDRASRSLQALSAALILTLLAVGLAFAVYEYPPPSPPFLLVGGVGAVGVLALAVARYDAAVALGFVLLAIVKVEPAPPDLVFMAVMSVAAVTGRFRLERVPLAVGASLGGFLVLNLLSATEAIDTGEALAFMSVTFYLAVFSLWLTSYVDSTRRARLIVVSYLVAAVASAILGGVAFFTHFPGSDALLFGEDRVKGLFKDANVYGPFMVPIALIVLEEIAQPRLLRMRFITKLVIFTMLLAAVLLSFSRGAWLNMAVGLVVLMTILLLRRGGSHRAIRLLIVTLVSAAVITEVAAASGAIEFLNERAGSQAYDVERFGAQESGLEFAAQYPAGVGPGQFEVLTAYSTHSTFVRALAEQGILGLAAFLALALITLVISARSTIIGRHTYGIGSAALLASWCGILINSPFVDTLHWRHLWVVAALIWVGAMRRTHPGAEAELAELDEPAEPDQSRPAPTAEPLADSVNRSLPLR